MLRVDRFQTLIAFFLCLFLTLPAHADDDTGTTCFRCTTKGKPGSSLACIGDTMFDVQAKCGQPDQQIVSGMYSRWKNVPKSSRGEIKRVTESIEKWYYNCGDGQFNVTLIFNAGDLVQIQKSDDRGSGPNRCSW